MLVKVAPNCFINPEHIVTISYHYDTDDVCYKIKVITTVGISCLDRRFNTKEEAQTALENLMEDIQEVC